MSLGQLLRQMDDRSELSWKDETYDLALARRLSADERALYVARLIENARKGDTHAILTLGQLNATEALPALEADAKSGNPWAATARRALVLLGRGAEVLTQIAHDAVHCPATMGRVAALLDLPKIGGPVAVAAIEQALVDEESDVRVIAWGALVEVLGVTKRLQNPEGARELTTEIEVMGVLLGSEIPALVEIGARRLREIVKSLADGVTPEALGIAWRRRTEEPVLDTLRKTLFRPEAEFPLDEIATLTGVGRLLAETVIVRRLEDGDERVPDALVRLGAGWTLPALEALAGSDETPTDLRDKLEEAVRALRTASTGG